MSVDQSQEQQVWDWFTALLCVCRGLLLPSQHQNLITGLNLLRLLVQNRIAEFHTDLELIPQEVMEILACNSLCQRLRRILQSLAFCTDSARGAHQACHTAWTAADGGSLQQGSQCKEQCSRSVLSLLHGQADFDREVHYVLQSRHLHYWPAIGDRTPPRQNSTKPHS